jgi:hypothetical protein
MCLWVSGWTAELLNMKALRSSETSGITFPATQYHISEYLNSLFNHVVLRLSYPFSLLVIFVLFILHNVKTREGIRYGEFSV